MQRNLKDRIRQKIITDYYSLLNEKRDFTEKELRDFIDKVWNDIRMHEDPHLTDEEKDAIAKEIVKEVIGFGPLDLLLNDHSVSEIMINGFNKIYVEKNGKTVLTGASFDNERHLLQVIQKMLLPTHRHVDESSPYTDIRLFDGSRANIIIAPVSLTGPVVTIRKFSKEINTLDSLIQLGTLDRRMGEFLVAAIKAKINIIFSGATGTGKTTTLNVLSSYIPEDERIISIEDTAELVLKQDHWVSLETKQPSIEGVGGITIRDLFKNSLRMRPDRIIIGEIRGVEALDMLQAICSGHRGSLAIVHASSPEEVIYRLETMIMTSENAISIEALRRQIASALNLIVHQDQLLDGSRRITHIAEVRGIRDRELIVEDLFTYQFDGLDADGRAIGSWKATGLKPLFYPTLRMAGVNLPEEIFNKV